MSTARRTRVPRHPGIYYREVDGRRRYEIAYRDSTGRQRWETVAGNLEAAEALRDERRGQKRRGELTAPAGVLFRDVRDRYLASSRFARLASTTRRDYVGILADHQEIMQRFGHMKVAKIDAEQLARFIHALEARGLRKASVQNALKPLSGVFRQAVKEKLIAASPFAMLDPDERPRPDAEPHMPFEWTDERLAVLLATARARAARCGTYDYSVMFETAAFSGLRLSEVFGLEWGDLELTKGSGAIHVRRQWTNLRELVPPKAGSARTVPIADDLVRTLAAWKLRALNTSEDAPVFVTSTGTRFEHANVQNRGFGKVAKDAGFDGCSFHDLRHYCGSRLAERGLTARQIADVLGHKQTRTTEIYVSRINAEQADNRVRQALSS